MTSTAEDRRSVADWFFVVVAFVAISLGGAFLGWAASRWVGLP